MKLYEFETFLASGVRKFCFLFDNSYTRELFFEHLRKKGYVPRTVSDPEIYKSQAFKGTLFEKPVFVCDYNPQLWKWLEGKQPLNILVMVAADSRTKAAEPFQGPHESEYLKAFRTDLEAKGIRYSEQGWNTLVQRFRNQEKVIEDPKGLYNAAYSIGLQVENPDANTINQFLGYRVKFWDLFNAMLAKDKRKGMIAVHTLLAESEPIGLCNGLQKMLSDLINAKECSKIKTAEQFAYEHKMAPYRGQMLYTQAKTLDDATQLKFINTLNQLELKLKSKSFLDPEEHFRTAILGYFS